VLHPTPREWAQICLVPELGFAALSTRAILRTAMLSGYHRVGIQQPGASVPIVVFTLELPESFPKGEPIREQVAVTGYFFKNWLFASGDGLSVAPIVLAKRIGWHRRPSRVREDVAVNSRDVLLVIALASVFGILTTWWLWTRVRTAGKKPSRGALTGSTAPDFSSIGRLLPHESRVLNERS
jgi:hypothetical protein